MSNKRVGDVSLSVTLKKLSTGSGSAMTTQVVAVDKNSKDCATGLTLQLTANVPLHNRDIHVLVSSRGQVQLWQSKPALATTTQFQNTDINSRTINVSLIADSKNIIGAGSRLVVFSVDKSSEVLSNGVELNQLTTCLANNDTQIRFEVDEVQPGHTVDLVMNTVGRDAQCAVSVIDAGLNAPDDENSKTAEFKRQILQKIVSLQNEMYSFYAQLYKNVYHCQSMPRTTIRDKPWYNPRIQYKMTFNGLDSSFFFDNSGILLLTNQRLHSVSCTYKPTGYKWKFDEIDDCMDISIVASAKEEYNPIKTKLKQQIKRRVRQFFPETWLWSSFRMNTSQQQHRMSVTAPDSITSWLANMACVSNSGLGVSPTAKLVVFQPFFLKLAMPYSAVRGERVRLPVSVHSYSSACYQVRSVQHTQ